MSLLTWVAWGGGLLIGLLILGTVYFTAVLVWEDGRTVGLGYYGRPVAERNRYRATLRRHATLLAPFLRILLRFNAVTLAKATFIQEGLPGPRGTCSPESFAAARRYRPRSEDVFVATQMKCGTTWMQHLVYQVVHRGEGTLVVRGATLYGECPWLEGRRSVPVDQAPAVGTARPSRIIKTHLPASACPDDPAAKYIYVARHPVSCFASCVDFIRTNLGAFAPGLGEIEAWFGSPDSMWWGTWTDHVAGWWGRAEGNPNVLFVHFEEMKRDLSEVARAVARFLDVPPLTEGELAQVVEKCGFRYMQEHQEAFEMHPPHILSVDATLFVRGTANRHEDVPPEVRERIRVWAAAELSESAYPLARFYPDVVSGER